MAGGFKLTRGRGIGPAQMSLVVCAIIAIFIVLLGKAESEIFDSMRAKLSDWAAPALEEVRQPLSALQQWVDGLGTVFTVYRENLRLRKENEELRKWQDVALALQQRLHRYQLLLNAVPDPQLPSVVARVIGQSSRPFIKTMILNAGKADAVAPGQAVLDERGLLGRVYLAGQHTAWVLLLTDLNSRVPVEIKPSNRRAILSGDNTRAPQLALDLGDVPVKPGDRVVSSGDGGLLPPDLPVGKVVADGSKLRVALFADPDVSDYVHVIEYKEPLKPPPGAVLTALPAERPTSPARPEQTAADTTAPALDKPAEPAARDERPPVVPRRDIAEAGARGAARAHGVVQARRPSEE